MEAHLEGGVGGEEIEAEGGAAPLGDFVGIVAEGGVVVDAAVAVVVGMAAVVAVVMVMAVAVVEVEATVSVVVGAVLVETQYSASELFCAFYSGYPSNMR